MHGKIFRGRKSTDTLETSEIMELVAMDTVMQQIKPSERQSAEWDMLYLTEQFKIF